MLPSPKNDGSYAWTVPNGVSNDVQIRITDLTNNQTFGLSSAYSSIALPFINITSPAGGATLAQCEQVTISWTSGGTVNNRYQVQWSDNGGTNWNTVVSNYSSTSYNWNYPSAVGNNIQLRVRDHNDYDNFDIVSPDLIFTPNTDIILINPNGGESLDAGTNYTIQWASAAVVDYVELYYSIDNGSTWTYIDFVYAPSSSTTWTTLYTVTVTDANGCVATDDVVVSIDNGLCDIEGCMDTDAYNYNPLATIDNGFCLYTEGGGGTCATDIDGDGIISTSDLLLVLGSFGSTCE